MSDLDDDYHDTFNDWDSWYMISKWPEEISRGIGDSPPPW